MGDRMSSFIYVEQPGFLTTVQDLGRFGRQRLGFTSAGAMDQAALIVANRLVGNPPDAAGLEITLLGPSLLFSGETVIALSGAGFRAHLNGRSLPLHQSVYVRSGDRLHVAGGREGCRCYLAVAGGLRVPPVHGSRATDLTAGIGGWCGRPLQPGDALPLPRLDGRELARRVDRRWDPAGNPLRAIRPQADEDGVPIVTVVRGQHAAQFDPDGIARFFSTTYQVAPQSDRVGLRLAGGAPVPYRGPDILSEGQPFGAIQVPRDGQPIVLMADRATVGGYPKLAIATTPAHGLLAQARPGSRLRFLEISHEQAVREYALWWRWLTGAGA